MANPDQTPTIPRPPAMPRVEHETPIPRLSDLEMLRKSSQPWLDALDVTEARRQEERRADQAALAARFDAFEARMLALLSVREKATSKSDLRQDGAIASLVEKTSSIEERMDRVEAHAASARADAGATLERTTSLDTKFSGLASPKVIGALAGGVALVELAMRVLSALGVHT